ncbi:MAG TPA: Rrf2 family transcriptional regulator [Thermoanaerobaculia bacterium]|nr:Rrf2 family transcriptional regulator [Thermoanaerobaculia bacterium]
MKLAKSTRYALYAAVEMAMAGEAPITVADVAGRYRLPESALAKVFQQLVRAGIALGTRGIGGGYRLARPRTKITILDVVRVFEPPRPEGQCLLTEGLEGSCPRPADCGLRQLFDEVDELVRCTYESVTLDTVIRRGGRARS